MTPAYNLRQRLRDESHEAHGRVDAIYRNFDVTRAASLRLFLVAHLRALEVLRANVASDEDEASLSHAQSLLVADLQDLGDVPSPSALASARVFNPIAVDYVLSGSRAGLAMLRRAWLASADEHAAKAGRYLSQKPGDSWRKLCRDLSLLPASGEVADVILADVIDIFALFERAGSELMISLEDVHA